MSRHHLKPGEHPKCFTQSERLANALKAVRAARTHVNYAHPPWFQSGPDLQARLDLIFEGLVAEESAICSALELAIDAEAKKGRAA